MYNARVAWVLVLVIVVSFELLDSDDRGACTAALTIGIGTAVAVPGVYLCAYRAGALGAGPGQGLAVSTLAARSPPCHRLLLGVALLTAAALCLVLRTVYAAAVLAGVVALVVMHRYPGGQGGSLVAFVTGSSLFGMALHLARRCGSADSAVWIGTMLLPAGVSLAGAEIGAMSRRKTEEVAAAVQLGGVAAVQAMALGARGARPPG